MQVINYFRPNTIGSYRYLTEYKMNYITVTQAAVRWGKTTSTVRLWCTLGLIAGAYKKSPRAWLIPDGSSMPIVPQGRNAQKRYRKG